MTINDLLGLPRTANELQVSTRLKALVEAERKLIEYRAAEQKLMTLTGYCSSMTAAVDAIARQTNIVNLVREQGAREEKERCNRALDEAEKEMRNRR